MNDRTAINPVAARIDDMQQTAKPKWHNAFIFHAFCRFKLFVCTANPKSAMIDRQDSSLFFFI
jgi:hypothetical protein